MILLDSHVLLWILTGRRKLGRRAAAAIERASGVYVSAATVWELTIKSMLGKVRVPEDLEGRLQAQGLLSLDITVAHGAAIRRFPELARHDPFDRLLVAQADVEGLRLMTADQVLIGLGRRLIVDATA